MAYVKLVLLILFLNITIASNFEMKIDYRPLIYRGHNHKDTMPMPIYEVRGSRLVLQGIFQS